MLVFCTVSIAMKKLNFYLLIGITFFGMVSLRCSKTQNESTVNTNFTKLDSLTDRYLEMRDSMFKAWNIIIMDENKKFKAMHSVVHELMYSGQEDKGELVDLEHRLNELHLTELEPETLENPDQLEEYDFAVNSLVTEVISLGESHSTFSYNQTLQKLIEDIRVRDQRVEMNRANYDSITSAFNQLLINNKSMLKAIDHTDSLTVRPLFGSVPE